MKLFIERTNEWVPVEMISDAPFCCWEYEWRKNKFVISQEKCEDIGRKIINDINDMLDIEMMNNDMAVYRKVMRFKGRE